MKKILNHLKGNWIRHGFETLVVVVGILGLAYVNMNSTSHLNNPNTKNMKKPRRQLAFD